MPDNTIQQIKDRLDIVEVISSYLKLEKTGINLRANCPFHQEKKPSFFVSPARQSFRCFGCGKGGDMFEFVQNIEGVEFIDALRLLAKRAGVEVKQVSRQEQSARQQLYDICELSCAFFEKQLAGSAKGKRARQYLLKRGLQEETIKKFRLGYSPDTWRGLFDFLVGRGFSREQIVQAGLAVQPDKGKTPYDRFRGRIIFPVFDLHSQVIGFGGRVFESEEETAKYLNTPNTPLYDKSKALYGLNFGKVAVRKNDFCLLTEGYMDVILCHQAGFLNTVSASGTALTKDQLKILKRYTTKLLTAFDMDKAGDLATQRGIDLALADDFEVKVIAMPQEKDPADIISQSPQKWQELVEGAQAVMDYYFSSAQSKYQKADPQGKKGMAAFLLPKIKQIPNQILQHHWLQKLAKVLQTSEEAIIAELKKVKTASPAETSSFRPKESSWPGRQSHFSKERKQLLQEKLIALLLQSPQLVKLVDSELCSFFSLPAKITVEAMQKDKYQEQDFNQLVERLAKKESACRDFLENCAFRAEIEPEEEPAEELKVCLVSLGRLYKQEKMKELSRQINLAEQNKDGDNLKSLTEKFNQLTKQSFF